MDIKLRPLDQQVIVITGASSGIGLATAEAAAEAGAKLVLAARSGETLAEVAARLGTGRAEAISVVGDVAEADAADEIAARAAERMPGLAKKLEAMQAGRQQLDEPPRDPEGTLRKPGESGQKRGDGPAGHRAAPR